jgi:hypothetical protein
MSQHCLYTDPRRVKVNVEYPAMPAEGVAHYHVGFIPALKGGAFSSNLRNHERDGRAGILDLAATRPS